MTLFENDAHNWIASLFQNELHIHNSTKDSSDPPNDSELGRQAYTKNTYKREGNGSESTDVGGTNSSTQTILANEQGNIAYENEVIETYGHDEIHAKGENSTASDIRGQASVLENAGEAKESSVNGHADQGKKVEGAGDVSQNGDPSAVQGNGPQDVGSNANHEVGTHADGVAVNETTPQREGEGDGSKGVEVTASTEGEAGLDNTDGSPSGNGEIGDEDVGSGDDEATEAGDKEGGHDDSEGQGEQSQGRDDNRGQSSVSGEDGDSKEKEGSPNGCGADGTTSSEENKNTEEGNGSQALQENQKLSHKGNGDPEGGITCQAETCTLGKSQDQVSFESDPFLRWLTFSPPHSNGYARQQTTNPDKYKIKPQTNIRNVTISVWVHFFF